MAAENVVAICQHGGEFSSGSDGSLMYVGGDAHAIEINRSMLLDNLKLELAAMFRIDPSEMSLKYFLPNNRRTLITISCDKDLQRMVEFTANAGTTEIFIITKVENRSVVAYSGTSSAVPNSRAGKRKKTASGNKQNKNNNQSPALRTCAAATTRRLENNAKQSRQIVPQNIDDRTSEIMQDFGFDIETAAAATPITPEFMKQPNLVLEGDQRENQALMAHNMGPFVDSDQIIEHIQPPSTPWADIITGVGQEFDNVKDFRSQLCKYAIAKGFVYRFVKNETTRVTVKCIGENCYWRMHASESSRSKKFVIKKISCEHTCGGEGSGDGRRRATRQWLTGIIKEKLHHNPVCKPKELVRELYEDYGVTLTYSQVWRGRETAQKELFQTMTEAFNQLPLFCEKIIESNPGSVAILSEPVDPKFRRFFVAFHASLSAFVRGCRPLIFLDKIPLRTTNDYKVLAAAAVDGNDALLPVAFAVVEDEHLDSWLWFLMQFKYAVDGTGPVTFVSHAITFVSHGQRGLSDAVHNVFGESHHALCLHYLMECFKAELRKGPWSQQIREGMVEDFTRAAQACTIEDFNHSVDSIRKISSEAADWLMASGPESWSDAIFRGCRYDHFSSNVVDSFGNWIHPKREASIVQLVEALRLKSVELILGRRKAGKDWPGPLTPNMQQKLEREEVNAKKLNVLCSSDTVFEVRGNTIYVVDIGNCECTCRRWQISGIPCVHAIAVFERVGRPVHDYCSDYYRLDCYFRTYSESIEPIPDLEAFNLSSGVNYCPPVRRQSDKPRRKRFPSKPPSVVRLCSRCKTQGHNKATCEAINACTPGFGLVPTLL